MSTKERAEEVRKPTRQLLGKLDETERGLGAESTREDMQIQLENHGTVFFSRAFTEQRKALDASELSAGELLHRI